MVKSLTFNAGHVGLIPDWELRFLHASEAEKKKTKMRGQCGQCRLIFCAGHFQGNGRISVFEVGCVSLILRKFLLSPTVIRQARTLHLQAVCKDLKEGGY